MDEKTGASMEPRWFSIKNLGLLLFTMSRRFFVGWIEVDKRMDAIERDLSRIEEDLVKISNTLEALESHLNAYIEEDIL